VESEGFVIGGILRTQVDGKMLTEVSIVRNDKKNNSYEYRKGQKRAELDLAYAAQQQEFTDGKQSRLQNLENKKPFLLKFDKKREMEKFENLAEALMQEYDCVVTRYLPTDESGEKMLAVFEQRLG